MTVSEKDEWAEKEAMKLAGVEFFLPENISIRKERQIEKFKAALLEAADRARKEDEALLRECRGALTQWRETMMPGTGGWTQLGIIILKLESRLGGRS